MRQRCSPEHPERVQPGTAREESVGALQHLADSRPQQRFSLASSTRVQAALKESDRSAVSELRPDVEVHAFVRCSIELEITGETGSQGCRLIGINAGHIFAHEPA